MRRKPPMFVLALLVGGSLCLSSAQQFRKTAGNGDTPTLWVEPSDIKSRNLYYGPGGKDGQPQGSLSFLREDPAGTSPKFEVRDSAGTKWKAKLGLEAQPETVATRMLWAVGFFANENYFEPLAAIRDLPRLSRGQEFVPREGVKGVRLQRNKNGKKIGSWSWGHNQLKGFGELTGLRSIMAWL